MTALYNITLTSDALMPKHIADEKVLNNTVMLVDTDRQWELDITKTGTEDSITMWVRLDKDGKQIEDTRINMSESATMDINPEVSQIVGLFLALKFEDITNMLYANAQAREAEERGLLGKDGYQMDVTLDL